MGAAFRHLLIAAAGLIAVAGLLAATGLSSYMMKDISRDTSLIIKPISYREYCLRNKVALVIGETDGVVFDLDSEGKPIPCQIE